MRLFLAVCLLSTSLIGGCAKTQQRADLDSVPPEAQPTLTFAVATGGKNGCLNECTKYTGNPKLHRTCEEFCRCLYRDGNQTSFTIGEMRSCWGRWVDELSRP